MVDVPVKSNTAPENTNRGLKRKADSTYYLCDVCRISLNSPIQALQHYQGRSHLAKVRESFQAVPATSSAGPPSSALTVDTGSDHAGPGSQKPQLTTGTVSLLPPQNDQTLDLYCSICGKSFNSQIQAQQHYNGKQHKNREEQQLQAKPVESFPDAVVIPGVGLAGSGEDLPPSCVSRTVKLGHNIKAKLLRCEACNITLNSEVQFSQHNRGLRHKMMTGQVTVTPPQEDAGWRGVRYRKLTQVVSTMETVAGTVMVPSSTPGGTRLGQFYCEMCNISMNSQIQLQQHLSGDKHKMRATDGSPCTSLGNQQQQRDPGLPGGRSGEGALQSTVPPSYRVPIPTLPPLYKSFICGEKQTSSNPPP